MSAQGHKRIYEYSKETRLYTYLSGIYGKKRVMRNVHPLWALSEKGVLLEFDIAIPDQNILVEYNGIQHYKYPNFFHKTKKEFQKLRKHDKLKKKLAKDNGWDFYIFKYTDYIDPINIKRKM